jgi:hypothetical protein
MPLPNTPDLLIPKILIETSDSSLPAFTSLFALYSKLRNRLRSKTLFFTDLAPLHVIIFTHSLAIFCSVSLSCSVRTDRYGKPLIEVALGVGAGTHGGSSISGLCARRLEARAEDHICDSLL